MSKPRIEWDWPPEPRRRRPRVEVLPPEPELRQLHVNVTVQRQRSALPRLVAIIAITFAVVMLWRFRLGALLMIVLAPQLVFAAVVMLVACAFAAWRNGRRGKPF
jgi:hypothetical protein